MPTRTHTQRRKPLAPLLTTKLDRPAGRAELIARERLLERLRPSTAARLTVVAAPAGYGKSTLLATWCELEESKRPVAWLTLDEGDRDPVVLWSHVVAALERACPELEVATSPRRLGEAEANDPFLLELINELTALGGITLVLDDFHRLPPGQSRDGLVWFVENVPSTLQLILATRSEPALPMGRLRASGALIEVRSEQLAFTKAEADVFLNDRLELGLECRDVERLVERTEGWPAGLYLAALSLQGISDRHAFVPEFTGAHRYVAEFFVDQVLEAHAPAMQALMVRCSVLKRICAGLCDAVLEREGSGGLLATLSRSNLFLVPLDDRGEWYRFHHLFAQLLRVELERREPGLAPSLHRRACAWHHAHGSPEEAIAHALEAGAFDEAGHLISTVWVGYAHAGRYTTVLAWLDRFPPEVLWSDQTLLLVYAWAASIAAKREAAAEAIAAVERMGRLDSGPLPDGFSSMAASIAGLRAAFPWGDLGHGLENARRALNLEAPGSPWRRLACQCLGFGHYYLGERAVAARWLAEAAESTPSSEIGAVIAASALGLLSLIAGDEGRVDEQLRFADRAAELGREHGLDGVDGDVYLATAGALVVRGQSEQALSVLDRAVAAGPLHPIPAAHAQIRRASILRMLGHAGAATAATAEAKRLLNMCPNPGVLADELDVVEALRTRPLRGRRGLTDRERVILRALGGGLSERDIGRELYVSHNTVHSHVRSIYKKLVVSSRSEAVGVARRRGLL